MPNLKVPPVKHASELVAWLREAAPYIHAFRGKTFVIAVPGETLADRSFNSLAQDVNLLASLGVRLVLAHGARPQIEAALGSIASQYVRGIRVTGEAELAVVKQEAGRLRLEIEAALGALSA
jgi:amino-acid N-acetyltransferase